jgi:hypothetical protein
MGGTGEGGGERDEEGHVAFICVRPPRGQQRW